MAALAVAARQPACKGFAIGRTIFGAAAEAWMNGTIDDEQARASVADAYRRMIEGWRRAREGSQAMSTVRLTMAQAIVKFLAAQQVEIDGRLMPLFGGVFAIFGHGNVAGLGEALAAARDILPTYRAHNEQAMAHAATAFAKAMNRRRMMACTSSIGPGATNMVTAAAVAHVNRLPLLLLPGDTFASRRPDPVLQQIEVVGDPTTTANDCFRPVSRYFDRITRPEQLVNALPEAVRVLTDPGECGPVTLCLPQDVQVEAGDFPEALFERRTARWRRPEPDRDELGAAAEALRHAERPMIVAGGGVKYSLASATLAAYAERHGVAVAETQAGKGSIAVGSSALSRRHRCHRLDGGEHAGPPGGRDPGGGHASAGLHHRIARAVQQCQADPAQCVGSRCEQEQCAGSGGGCAGGLERLVAGARRLAGAAGVAGPSTRGSGRMAQDGRQGDCGTARQHAAERCAGARCRQPPDQPATTSWSARQAACRASCTSCGGPRSPRAIIWNMAIPAWVTRLPAASGRSSPCPTGGSSCWSEMAPI